jgi:alkaline phosphatase D
MVEGRDFRSPNNAPDGPTKTIWGAEQMAWFKKSVAASDAAFRVLISPTPIVGPDRDNKRDNHSNKVFTHEGDQLRAFIAKQKNMVVICGDRHWQYLSIHPKTGVREYSCGPASNQHAGGWRQSDYRKDIHQYLNVTGGFLSGTVERKGGKPSLIFRWHDVKGKVLNTDFFGNE